MRYNVAADSFYIMKLCSRLFVLYCRSRPKDDKSRHFDPYFEEVRSGVIPWLMAQWKVRVEFLFSVIELLSYLLRLRRYKAKCVKLRCLQEGVGDLEPKFQGKGRPWGIVLRAVVVDTIPACDGRTDRRTDRQTELL